MTEVKSQFLDMTPEQLALYREQLQECVKQGEALERLEKNQDFIDLFKDGYCKEEAVRTVNLFGDHAYLAGKRQDAQSDLMDRIVGISKFSEHLRFLNQRANQCKYELSKITEQEIEFYKNV